MHLVGNVDWSFADKPAPKTANASGLSRMVLVGSNTGATHTEVAAGSLAPAGWIRRHIHSFEEALYVLKGDLLLDIDGHIHCLTAGDYALMPVGVWHALANASGAPVHWLSVNTPQRLPLDAPRRDTFYGGSAIEPDPLDAIGRQPDFSDPSTRYVGHYEGTPPQVEALSVTSPTPPGPPVGMDAAILAYGGISVKMLVDRNFGADLLTISTVDYEVGASAQAHDHPFEETYFLLDGSIEAELDGKSYHLQAGDIVFAGVGSVHAFRNAGTQRVRWLQTQAPQPPVRNAERWLASWKRFETAGERSPK